MSDSDHDPLCQNKDRWNAGLSVGDVSGDCPGCSFIAKVRADERARMMRVGYIEPILLDLRAKVQSLVDEQNAFDRPDYRNIRRAALREVLDLLDGSGDA